MKTVGLAAILAIIAEASLLSLGNAYGKIDFNGGDENALGAVAFMFHLPAGVLGNWLFGTESKAEQGFVMFVGAVQFFLVALPIVAICQAFRRKNDA